VSSRFLNQPAAENFESLFHGARSVVQIVGPGGGGKTTLAKHIGDLALAGGEPGAFKIQRLPIWIDEDFVDLRAVVRRKLNSWYKSGEAIEEPLLSALMENGLLLVMVDRVSERLPGNADLPGERSRQRAMQCFASHHAARDSNGGARTAVCLSASTRFEHIVELHDGGHQVLFSWFRTLRRQTLLNHSITT
jgi:hypothetical protein